MWILLTNLLNKTSLVIGSFLVVAILSGGLSWNVRGWKADSEVSAVRQELLDYKLSVSQDASQANYKVSEKLLDQLNALQLLQAKNLQETTARNTLSSQILNELKVNNEEISKSPICVGDQLYLDKLRDTLRSGN